MRHLEIEHMVGWAVLPIGASDALSAVSGLNDSLSLWLLLAGEVLAGVLIARRLKRRAHRVAMLVGIWAFNVVGNVAFLAWVFSDLSV